MEETVYAPVEFFNLPDYLQRKILIEELDYESIENLCEAVEQEEDRNPRATRFFQDFCMNAQFWKDKFRYSFPRGFDGVNRAGVRSGAANYAFYWKNSYRTYEETMSFWEANLIESSEEGSAADVWGLLGFGVNPNFQDDSGKSALMAASKEGHTNIVDILLESGADPNLQNIHGETALMSASLRGHLNIVRELLGSGADPNLQDGEGLTALTQAFARGHFEVIKELLKEGADPDIQDNNEQTVLMLASVGGDKETVQLLLGGGADPNLRERRGHTALMFAAMAGQDEVIDVLSVAGADVDLQNVAGETALNLALRFFKGDYKTIFGIIRYEPNPDIQDNRGETAIDIAERKGFDSVVDALLYLRREKGRR